MAMSEATSSPPDWARVYQRGVGVGVGTGASGGSIVFSQPSSVSDSTVVTTTGTAQPPTAPTTGGTAEGRVARPARRRSRASRRAPTTLLNTDTTNFRAMVQQFTGIPSAPYASSYQAASAGPVINFGLGFNEQFHQAALPPPFARLQHLQQYQHPQQSSYQQYQPPQQDGGAFTLGSNAGEMFLHGFNNHRANLEAPDGFLLDGISSQMIPRPASTDTRADGYHL